MHKIRFGYGYAAALIYAALAAAMFLFNFTMDRFEPFSLALLCAMPACGLDPLLSALLFTAAGAVSLTAGWVPFLVYAGAGLYLGGVFFIYARAKRQMRAELALWLLPAAALFVWLFGKYVYADYIRALWAGGAIYILCFIVTGALGCLFFRAGRCRLTAEELIFCAAAAAAAGIGFYKLAGEYVYGAAALLVLLFCLGLAQNANAVVCALVIALPEAIVKSASSGSLQLFPLAAHALCAAAGLAFWRAGKFPASLAVFLTAVLLRYAASGYAGALPEDGFWLSLLVPLLPCMVFALAPEKKLQQWSRTLKKYGEKQLTRLAINGERALTAERLFEMADVFREIENAFAALETEAEDRDGALKAMEDGLYDAVCKECENRENCAEHGVGASLSKLVAVGAGKGKVNLIDMPSLLSAECVNPSGILFYLNKLLAEYRRYAIDMENAALGRKLLQDQAGCVGEMLKTLAVEQSRPLGASPEKERELFSALAKAGVVCQEAMVTEKGVSLTAAGKYDTATILRAVEGVFSPAVLSKKRALAADKFCYEFKKRPRYDAAFGAASVKKEGESASGDTHSVLKIDERTFLMALSDGMGSGEYARTVSETTISLLESFYRAKLPPERILETVNRLLSFNKEESFACADIAAVDLDDGFADIVKIGSPLGFILSKNEIEILGSESLPLGILDGVRPTTLRKQLGDGDTLLFISDGVTDAFGSSADIAEFLQGLSPHNPQSLADAAVQEGLRRQGGAARDDMTAVAARLFSRETA